MFVASRLIQRIQFSRAFPTQACFAVQFSKALHSASSSGELLSQHFKLIEDVITEEEEEELLNYLNPMLDRKRYEGNHWDSVITLYKEMELHSVSSRGIKQPDRAKEILGRVAELATQHYKHDIKLPLLPPHAIDLHEDGHIDPHVDSVKFGGGVLSGLSLLSPRVMRLLPDTGFGGMKASAGENENTDKNTEENGQKKWDESEDAIMMLLPPRSLYMLEGPLRYEYAHAVLGREHSDRLAATAEGLSLTQSLEAGGGVKRRLSVIFRDEPHKAAPVGTSLGLAF